MFSLLPSFIGDLYGIVNRWKYSLPTQFVARHRQLRAKYYEYNFVVCNVLNVLRKDHRKIKATKIERKKLSISSLAMSKLFLETFWVGYEEERMYYLFYCVIYGLFKFNLKVAHPFPLIH